MTAPTDPPPAAATRLPKDIAAEKGMVNVEVNGVWHQFPKGMRMIEALESIGVEVPHYCYHGKLSSPGSCRMCMVEQGMPPRSRAGAGPAIRQPGIPAHPVDPPAGDLVFEHGGGGHGDPDPQDAGQEVRNGVMEFLLVNHPLDCPICDQAGECRLQEFCVAHGQGGSRFREAKVRKPKNVDIGPRIRLG